MDSIPYRSFVVRLWVRHGTVRRATIESVQSTKTAELGGDQARRLAAALDEALTGVEPGNERPEARTR